MWIPFLTLATFTSATLFSPLQVIWEAKEEVVVQQSSASVSRFFESMLVNFALLLGR